MHKTYSEQTYSRYIRRLRNVIIQYKGGGYDGCFWEWNFAYIDKEGIFESIFNSGVNGAKTVERLAFRLSEASEYRETNFFYCLDKESDVDEFLSENAPDNVEAVGKWLDNKGIELQAVCDICKHHFPAHEMQHDGYHGDGGIGIVNTGCICQDCYTSNTCGYCGEYYGPDYKGFDNEGYCEYCYDKNNHHEVTDLEFEKDCEVLEDFTGKQAEEHEAGYLVYSYGEMFWFLTSAYSNTRPYNQEELLDRDLVRRLFEEMAGDELIAYYAIYTGKHEIEKEGFPASACRD